MSDGSAAFRTPNGVVVGYGDVASAEVIDYQTMRANAVADMRRADPLPDPANLTVGDVARAIRYIECIPPAIQPQWPELHDAALRRDAMLGQSRDFAKLRDWTQANLGVEPSSTEAIQVVIGRVATKLRKLFPAVESMALADAVRLLEGSEGTNPEIRKGIEEPREILCTQADVYRFYGGKGRPRGGWIATEKGTLVESYRPCGQKIFVVLQNAADDERFRTFVEEQKAKSKRGKARKTVE